MFGLGRKCLKAAEGNCLKVTCRPRRRRDCQQRRRQLQLCRPPLSPRELQSHEHFFPLFRAPEHLQPPELSRRIKYALQSLTKVTMTQLHPLARRATAAASTSSLPDITSASVWLTQSMSVAARSASGTSDLAGAAFSTVVTPEVLDLKQSVIFLLKMSSLLNLAVVKACRVASTPTSRTPTTTRDLSL